MNKVPSTVRRPVMNSVESMADQVEATSTDVFHLARRTFLAYVGAAVTVQQETEKAFDGLVRKGEKAHFAPVVQVERWMKRANQEVEQAGAKTEDMFDDMVEEVQARFGVASQTDVQRLNQQLDSLNRKIDAFTKEIEADRLEAERKAEERREAQKRAAEKRAAEKAAEERRVAQKQAAEKRVAEKAAEERKAKAEQAEATEPVDLPVSNYERLTVDQAVARLQDLSVEDLRAVRAYEEDNKARVGVIRAIDERLNTLLPLQNYDDMTVDEVQREINDLSVDELRAIARYEVEHKNRKSLIEDIERRLNWLLPVAKYDDMNVDQAGASVEGLAVEDLRRVRQYEVEHKNRKGVLDAIDDRIVVLEQEQK